VRQLFERTFFMNMNTTAPGAQSTGVRNANRPMYWIIAVAILAVLAIAYTMRTNPDRSDRTDTSRISTPAARTNNNATVSGDVGSNSGNGISTPTESATGTNSRQDANGAIRTGVDPSANSANHADGSTGTK
jgi:hypothetical protein